MMTILLYGHLGRTFGRVHKYAVANAAEAVRAMTITLPGFKKAVIDGGYYKVLVGGRESLSKTQLHDPVSQKKTIRLVPTIIGAGKGVNIIVGAILVAVSIFVPGMQWLAPYGYSMIIGGIAQMLFAPKPAQSASQSTERPENRPSYTFDGAINTASQGNPVSVLYGELIVGSQVASAGLASEQI